MNECTHHPRKHIKNAKCSLFSKDDKGLILSIDDKAYLRPIATSTFRIISGHQEVIEDKVHLVNDVDQTIVTVRPKYYICSSGSVWASETMLLRIEVPKLFEVVAKLVHIDCVAYHCVDFALMFMTVYSIFKTQQCMKTSLQ
jgi:hypothetical protein